jgi:hypothetical protein
VGPKSWLALAIVLVGLTAAGDDLNHAPDQPSNEFHFTRMYYSDGRYGSGWGGGSFRTDFPEAEYRFTVGVSRLTRVDIGSQARGSPSITSSTP